MFIYDLLPMQGLMKSRKTPKIGRQTDVGGKQHQASKYLLLHLEQLKSLLKRLAKD